MLAEVEAVLLTGGAETVEAGGDGRFGTLCCSRKEETMIASALARGLCVGLDADAFELECEVFAAAEPGVGGCG